MTRDISSPRLFVIQKAHSYLHNIIILNCKIAYAMSILCVFDFYLFRSDMANNEMVEESLSAAQSLASHQSSTKTQHRHLKDSKSSSPSFAAKKSGILSNTSGRLYKVIRRNSSQTLPPKKIITTLSPQQKMKKKVSLPVLEGISNDTPNQRPKSVEMSGLTAGGLLNYQRPLPPSPPPSPDTAGSRSDACFPLEEGELKVKTERDTAQDEASKFFNESRPSVNIEKHESTTIKGGMSTRTRSVSLSPMQSMTSSMKASTTSVHSSYEMAGSSDKEPQLQHGPNVEHSAVNTSMSLEEALKKYNHHFPLRLKVMEGYCSEDSEHNLSTNDIYDIHFVKQTRVITLKDSDGFMHQIPLASSMKFGLVYNPNNNLTEALAGHQFEKCSDIMAAEIMPQVVCATIQVESTEENHSIATNEIVVVKQIQKPKLRGRRSLKVFSLLSHTEKILPEECMGMFTTKPSLIQLHLPQIVQSISKPFPTQAVLYVNSDCPELPKKLNIPLSGIITLCDCTTEISLVASSVSDDGCDEDQIILQLNDEMTQLEVQVISWRGVRDSATAWSDAMPVNKAEHMLDEKATDLYDDILVLQANRCADQGNDVYDDIIVTKRKVALDEPSLGAQSEPQSTDQLQEGEYDSIPVERISDSYHNREHNFEQSM